MQLLSMRVGEGGSGLSQGRFTSSRSCLILRILQTDKARTFNQETLMLWGSLSLVAGRKRRLWLGEALPYTALRDFVSHRSAAAALLGQSASGQASPCVLG